VSAPPVATLVPCPNHPDVAEGLGACGVCGRNFCGDCLVQLGGVSTCADCKLERLASLRSGDVELNLAGPWKRLLAVLVDWVIFFVPSSAVSLGGLFFFNRFAALTPGAKVSPQEALRAATTSVLLNLLWMAVIVTYEALMLSKYGQTLGKMAVGVKVVTPGGADIRAGQAWLRAGSRSLMGFICCLGFADWLYIFSARGRTLHDRLAQTVVVNWKQ
jgi:uncharacterized RDD family membrane protein YckC